MAAIEPDLAAREFLREFATAIVDVQLRWSSPQVTVLSDDVATPGAAYEEVLRDAGGSERRFEGYFTGSGRAALLRRRAST